MGESYREYFVKRKAPWLYSGWVAVCGDKKPQETPGEGRPLGHTLNDSMGRLSPRSPLGGMSIPLPMLWYLYQKEVSEDFSRCEVYPAS